MSRPTTIMRPSMHGITTSIHQAIVVAFNRKFRKRDVSSRADLFIHVTSCEWHFHLLATKPEQWPSSKIKIR